MKKLLLISSIFLISFNCLSQTKGIGPEPFIINPDVTHICNGTEITYELGNIDEYLNCLQTDIKWSSSSSNLVLKSGQGTKKAVFTAMDNYKYPEVNVSVSINVPCLNDRRILESSKIRIGVPPPPYSYSWSHFGGTSTSEVSLDPSTTYPISITAPSILDKHGSTGFIWTVSGNASIIGNSIDVTFIHLKTNAATSGNFNITIVEKNKCGISVPYTKYGVIKAGSFAPGPGGLLPFNPGWSDGPIPDNKSLVSPITYNIKIYSFPSGNTVYRENGTIDFNIEKTSLNSGIYIIEKTDNNGNITKIKVKKN